LLFNRLHRKYSPYQQQLFVTHLIELRARLLRVVAAVLIVFLLLAPFAGKLYTGLAHPLLSRLPAGATMIATEVSSPFLTPFKFAFVLAIFITMPFILYQIWAFIAPGLYRRERSLAMPLLLSSVVLFYLGMAFAYFVVFPMVFRFMVSTAPQGVSVMTDIAKYLDFVLKMFFAFGVAFEVPIATFILVRMGVTTPESLVAKRPYIIVGAFVVGMLLTPPDVLSQTLLAVPMWMLFELGVWMARRFPGGEDTEPEADEASAHDAPGTDAPTAGQGPPDAVSGEDGER
jgi:sec-independent protein translocase protein TatC